jgi:hypothetical protein
VPVHRELRRVHCGKCRRYISARDAPNQRDQYHRDGRPLGVEAAVRPLQHQDAAKQCTPEDRDIGTRLDQPGASEHFIFFQMLRQDGVFYGAEECRMDPHGREREQQQRHIVEQQPGGARNHDQYFRGLYDAYDPRLVAGIGELAGKR